MYTLHNLFHRIYNSVNDLHFEDFTLENCRQFGFDIKNGRQLTFRNMEIKNTGTYTALCLSPNGLFVDFSTDSSITEMSSDPLRKPVTKTGSTISRFVIWRKSLSYFFKLMEFQGLWEFSRYRLFLEYILSCHRSVKLSLKFQYDATQVYYPREEACSGFTWQVWWDIISKIVKQLQLIR